MINHEGGYLPFHTYLPIDESLLIYRPDFKLNKSKIKKQLLFRGYSYIGK